MPRTSARNEPARAAASFGMGDETPPGTGFGYSRRGSRGMEGLLEGMNMETWMIPPTAPNGARKRMGGILQGRIGAHKGLNTRLHPIVAWRKLRRKLRSTRNTTAPPLVRGSEAVVLHSVRRPGDLSTCRPAAAAGHRRGLVLLGTLHHDRLRREQQPRGGRGVLQRGAGHLRLLRGSGAIRYRGDEVTGRSAQYLCPVCVSFRQCAAQPLKVWR
jgi:hypothetical protein